MQPLVIGHAHCVDGFAAMWVADRALRVQGQEPELLSAQYGEKPPEVSGRTVYIVDFSYPRVVLEELASKAKSLVVIDHHKSAQKDLEGLPYCTFDLTESGATLTWRHFHDTNPLPTLLQYVKDFDLWKHELPYTQEINAWLAVQKFDLTTWDRLDIQLDHGAMRGTAVTQGRAILEAENKYVKDQRRFGIEGFLGGVPMLGCNCTHLRSKVGDELSQKTGAAATWFVNENGSVHWSLRLSKEGKARGLDMTKVAGLYGGGGHVAAAAFDVGWEEHAEIWAQFPHREKDYGEG